MSFWHSDSLLDISLHIKSQNKAIDGSADIFNRCYSQISVIFYVWWLTHRCPDKWWTKWMFLFNLGLGYFDAENIDIGITEKERSV